MPLRHLVVTPLPNGRTGPTARLSVHLSPRLRKEGLLSDYPDLGDWGQFVTTAPALTFQVVLNRVNVVPAASVAVVSPPVVLAVWRALFGRPADKVPVLPTTFLDRTTSELTSMDSAATTEACLDVARAVAGFGAAPATAEELADLAATLRPLLDAARTFYGKVGDEVDPAPPSIEFHDQLGPLGAHPYLLRVLGLVFDLEVTLPAGATPTEVAVRTNWVAKAGDVGGRDEIPLRVLLDADFRPTVADETYRTGAWLQLSGSRYRLAQLDQVHATQQLRHLDDALAVANAADPVDVPALLDSGLSVIHQDLAAIVTQRFERQLEIEAGIDDYIRSLAPRAPLLFAEDITTGVRYDAEDVATPGYRSLHQRQLPLGYEFPRDKALAVVPPEDEGWQTTALSTDGGVLHIPAATNVRFPYEGSPAVEKQAEQDITSWRVDDHIVTWNGWSLSTPAPGTSATGDGTVKEQEANRPAPGSPIQVVAPYEHVNGTLPRLRYGHTYRLRGRTVDLAGNGPALMDAAPVGGESPEIRFGRLAPLVPPTVLRRASRPDPGVGDLPHVLVIRSELDGPLPGNERADRLLFPPRIGQSRLEHHDLPSGGVDPGSYALLAQRDALSLADQTVEDPETGELVAGGPVVNGQVSPGPTRPPVLYLADPVAQRVAFHDLPRGGTAPALLNYGSWPTFQAVQLELVEGVRPPRVVPAQRRVTVSLPKGTVAIVEVSHAPDPALAGHLLLAQDPAAAPSALDGTNRAISPRRSLTLVHAVRVPLQPPTFDDVAGARTLPGQTTVALTGALDLHRATTERTVLRTTWTDTVDDPAEDGPQERTTTRVVDRRRIDIAPPADGGTPDREDLGTVVVDLGDTRRRALAVTSEAFCRFSRYFTERREVVVPTTGPAVLDGRGVVARSVVVTDALTGTPLVRDTHFTVDRDAGTLTVIDATVAPPGTTLRAEFIPRPVSRLSTEAVARGTARVDVPSSAAPPVPDVVAALPAFARTVDTATPGRIHVVHDGRVVRLHLARPWFVSGRDERLGVAIALVDAEPRSRWARDPLAAGPGSLTPLDLASFGKATVTAVSVDGRFDVAAHDVVYDAARRVWLCDVQLDVAEAYRPFVFLQVCRYQELSVAGLHASPVVALAPLRLGARREITVTRLAPGQVSVALTGPDAGNTVTVTEQAADPAVTDPDLRWLDVATTALARTGTTSVAAHTGEVTLVGAAGTARRLVIDDAEPDGPQGRSGGSTVVAYREVVALPSGW